MLRWVWFLEFSWGGKVDSRHGLPGKQKPGAVQRLKWGQDSVYMILYNSLCQLLVFTACHFLYLPNPTVQWHAKTARHSGSERVWHSLKKYLHGLFRCLFTNLTLIVLALHNQCKKMRPFAENISYVSIMIPNALPPGWQEEQQRVVGSGRGSFLSIISNYWAGDVALSWH